MQQFSKLKPQTDFTPKQDNVLFDGGHLSVINYEDWSVIKEPDFVVCIIYLIEENQFILRHEYIPTFKMVDGQEYHMTVLSGTMKEGETPERTLLREIEEEAGIVIRPDFKIEFMKPLFISKGHSSKYHPALITLTERDYHEILPPTDGTRVEKLSRTVKIDTKFVKSINSSDLITEYMINQFQNYLNL
jgi:8-oxo-dGTP pyrophosphatase MutT (NUDIX family)